jgi:hypothetical protein
MRYRLPLLLFVASGTALGIVIWCFVARKGTYDVEKEGRAISSLTRYGVVVDVYPITEYSRDFRERDIFATVNNWSGPPEDFRVLEDLENIYELSIINTRLNTKHFEIINRLHNLDTLILDKCVFSEDDLSVVRDLSHLRTLRIVRTPIVGKGLVAVRQLPCLATLELESTLLSDDYVDNVFDTKNLRRLDLNYAGISDKGVGGIDRLTKLKMLSLKGNAITDESLKVIAKTKIENLFLDNSPITDEGLQILHGMSALRLISVRNTKVSRAGVEKFEAKTGKQISSDFPEGKR